MLSSEVGEEGRAERVSPVVSLLGRRALLVQRAEGTEDDRRGIGNKVDIQNEEVEHRCVHEYIEKSGEAAA